jgi:hypothetical protein
LAAAQHHACRQAVIWLCHILCLWRCYPGQPWRNIGAIYAGSTQNRRLATWSGAVNQGVSICSWVMASSRPSCASANIQRVLSAVWKATSLPCAAWLRSGTNEQTQTQHAPTGFRCTQSSAPSAIDQSRKTKVVIIWRVRLQTVAINSVGFACLTGLLRLVVSSSAIDTNRWLRTLTLRRSTSSKLLSKLSPATITSTKRGWTGTRTFVKLESFF